MAIPIQMEARPFLRAGFLAVSIITNIDVGLREAF